MVSFRCPICHGPLRRQDHSLYCPNRHCFDLAKSGYVNLLPANRMHSKLPGDNKLMVQGRNSFLNRGYYAPLLDALREEVREILSNHGEPCEENHFTFLDAGCGEGYYTAGMAEELAEKVPAFTALGVDISKTALALAAKRTKLASFAVASVFDLPIEDRGCDLVTEIFAPFCREEFYRVLKSGAILLLVIPSADHLFELKQAVYREPYLNEAKPYELEGFTLMDRREVQGQIDLSCTEDIQNLFTMTPYYYKTSREDAEQLLRLEQLTTTIHFELLRYQKVK